MEKDKEFIDIYIEINRLKGKLKKLEQKLESYNINLNKFEETYRQEIHSTELDVFERYLKGKSLKNIANEKKVDYSNVRRSYSKTKKKINLISTYSENSKK